MKKWVLSWILRDGLVERSYYYVQIALLIFFRDLNDRVRGMQCKPKFAIPFDMNDFNFLRSRKRPPPMFFSGVDRKTLIVFLILNPVWPFFGEINKIFGSLLKDGCQSLQGFLCNFDPLWTSVERRPFERKKTRACA